MAHVDKPKDYYADLDVSPEASLDDIKKQWKKLGIEEHLMKLITYLK
jgi:DnaJ-class molecular chaperone